MTAAIPEAAAGVNDHPSDALGDDPNPAPPIWADVLIVGGGLVGGTLAIALAQGGLTSLVIEAGDPQAALDAGFDGRCSAIALTSQRMLAALGLWEPLTADAAPMLDIRVSDGASSLFLHYDHRDVGDQPFGYMLENRLLRRALLTRMRAEPAIRLIAPDRITRLERAGDGVEARLASGGRLRATLVIAADGRGSRIRDEAGIRVTRWSYGQTAIVCTVRHQRSHDFIAHEHFLPAGPFAILPLQPGDRSSLVWTERAELAPLIMGGSDAQFLAELERRFGDFLGNLTVEGPRFSHPLSLQYAWRAVDRRLALVGDAAHAMHPIAGQGLNMGFRDVAALAEVLGDAKRRKADPGAPQVLARYQRWRRFDNTLMLAMTDGLNRLFSNDIAPIRLARDLGLAGVNRMPALKRLFMRHAMGLAGELPRLMRG
ncbi:MAG: UbiH/UbiF/VisC/COQ6 family ubiquinone biosynthesis hydroxylase [Rhodospirillales bacterium]